MITRRQLIKKGNTPPTGRTMVGDTITHKDRNAGVSGAADGSREKMSFPAERYLLPLFSHLPGLCLCGSST